MKLESVQAGRRSGTPHRAQHRIDLHVPPLELPLELADLHRSLAPGDPVEIELERGDGDEGRLADILLGAGFGRARATVDLDVVRVATTRLRSLPDTVGSGMRLLVCGLNPSEYAADRGVGYARPGNRFWPAALQAGLVTRDRDPLHALTACGVGMTDLVKRATPAAAGLSASEYEEGAGRVERLVRWLEPAAVCFVGLGGWRSAVDRHAAPGLQSRRFGGRPAYVMPSTSGLNARTPLADLAGHLAAAAELACTG